MTELHPCPRCEGLVPATMDHCPHCERRGPLRRLAETAVGGALAMTLMACYGASYAMREPMPDRDPSCAQQPDRDGDGYCERDCDDTDRRIHPEAQDAPGDGIDQDCSGEDEVGDVVLEPETEEPGADKNTESPEQPPADQEMAE